GDGWLPRPLRLPDLHPRAGRGDALVQGERLRDDGAAVHEGQEADGVAVLRRDEGAHPAGALVCRWPGLSPARPAAGWARRPPRRRPGPSPAGCASVLYAPLRGIHPLGRRTDAYPWWGRVERMHTSGG